MLLRLLQLTQSNDEIIGLDIGSDFIKLLKINKKTSPKMVEKFAVVPLPSGAIIKNEIKEPRIVAEIIKNSLDALGIKTKEAALAISRSSTIMKNITVDKRLTADELESRAWIEASHQFPDLVGESYLDFTVIGDAPKDPSQLEVTLVACRKEVVDPYIELLHLAGLVPKIMDVNSFAFERTLLEIAKSVPQNKTIALLNLDTSLSTLIVLHENKLIYAHDERFDADRLLKQVKEAGADAEKQNTILKETISAHLRHTMHFFYSTRSQFTIEKLFVGGDCTKGNNLIDFIKNETGIDTQVANPFMNMRIHSAINQDEFKQFSSSLVLCAGLALSDIEAKGI